MFDNYKALFLLFITLFFFAFVFSSCVRPSDAENGHNTSRDFESEASKAPETLLTNPIVDTTAAATYEGAVLESYTVVSKNGSETTELQNETQIIVTNAPIIHLPSLYYRFINLNACVVEFGEIGRMKTYELRKKAVQGGKFEEVRMDYYTVSVKITRVFGCTVDKLTMSDVTRIEELKNCTEILVPEYYLELIKEYPVALVFLNRDFNTEDMREHGVDSEDYYLYKKGEWLDAIPKYYVWLKGTDSGIYAISPDIFPIADGKIYYAKDLGFNGNGSVYYYYTRDTDIESANTYGVYEKTNFVSGITVDDAEGYFEHHTRWRKYYIPEK